MSAEKERLRKIPLAEEGRANDLAGTTVDQRIAMMWPLAIDAAAFMGVPVPDDRVQRDVVRVIRLQDDHGWMREEANRFGSVEGTANRQTTQRTMCTDDAQN